MTLNELVNNEVKTREIIPSFEKAYDLAVVGLGTAGSIALITACRSGLSVLGIEQLNAMGGTGTVGGMSSYYYGAEGGFFQEIDKEAEALEEIYFIKGKAHA